MIVRKFSAYSDYAASARVASAAAPDYPESAERLAARDEAVRKSGGTQTRWLAWDDETPVATSVLEHFTWCTDPTVMGVGVRVIPERRHEGIGRSLHDTMLTTARASGCTRLVGFIDARQRRSLDFAAAAGYDLVGRGFESSLDPAAIDLERFADIVAAVVRSGIRIDPLSEISQTEPDWVDRVAELYATIEEDVPTAVPTAPPVREVFIAEAIESSLAIPEAFFIARDGERWVGLTEIRKSQLQDHYHQELTGVLRAYRRRGIAVALKVRGLLWARSAGAVELKTWNDGRNRGMLAVNGLLGFVRSHSIDEYHRPVASVASRS